MFPAQPFGRDPDKKRIDGDRQFRQREQPRHPAAEKPKNRDQERRRRKLDRHRRDRRVERKAFSDRRVQRQSRTQESIFGGNE